MKLLALSLLILLVDASRQRKRPSSIRPKIVNGVNAKFDEFPSMVALVRTSGKLPEAFCAGTFISNTWVLTAAHCYLSLFEFVLQYGSKDILWPLPLGRADKTIKKPENKPTTEPSEPTLPSKDVPKVIKPMKFIKHEKYDDQAIAYNIGMIKTERHNVAIQVAKLVPLGISWMNGDSAVVAGWGVWNRDNDTIPPLQKTNLKLYDHETCRQLVQHIPDPPSITQHQICTYGNSSTECAGDSGGPLFLDGIQLGIVSHGSRPCGISHEPGVFTKVSFFIPWIQEKTGLQFSLKSYLVAEPTKNLKSFDEDQDL